VRANLPRSAAACPDDRYTRIPNSLHALAETPREYQLVALLLSFRWYPTSPIIPSVDTIAAALGCSHRTVRRTVAALEARGLLQRVERRAADDRQLSNEYALCGPLLAAVTAVESSGDQERRQPWPGRRSNVPGERNQGNQTNRNQRTERAGATANRWKPGCCQTCGWGGQAGHTDPACYGQACACGSPANFGHNRGCPRINAATS
jgi:hypothetical protein